MQLINQIKKNRRDIDAIINAVDQLEKSAEVTLAKRALQKSQMFLGLLLGELKDSPNPYPASCDPKSNVIEDRADQADEAIQFGDHNEIGKVKYLRSLIELKKIEIYGIVAHQVFEDGVLTEPLHSSYFPFSDEAYRSITEAKLWLGQQLNNIHESAQK